MTELLSKFVELQRRIAAFPRLAVAFSGGVDSTFLLKVAHDLLGGNAIAISVDSVFVAGTEKSRAEKFCESEKISLYKIAFDPLAVEAIRSNPRERCYFCKKAIFSRIVEFAGTLGFAQVADGTNADDCNDFRPGMRALRELKIVSPLQDCGLTKAEIRALSRELNLPTADLPAAACLASRIAYGETLTAEKLARVDAAENFLRERGFLQCRVRVHGNLARIELGGNADFEKAFPWKNEIVAKLKTLGFDFVTLDLEGYRMGSFNLP